MRTKALVLAAAVVAGTALTASAQTVYSVNAVGYVNLAIPQGWSMIANPLVAATNTLAALMPSVPEDTVIYKWTGTSFQISIFSFGEWDNPNITLVPGEACFINATAAFTNTFVGEVMQSPNTTTPMTNSFPVGFSMRSSQVPQEGTATALGFVPPEDTAVYQYDNAQGKWKIGIFSFGEWDTVPTFKVGEGFWIQAATAGQWTRIFTVNQ